MSRCLIVGAGEVGKSLYEVLKVSHETYLKDLEPLEVGDIEVLNICFPPSPDFQKQVREYQEQYRPKVTIIHSTVPVGTSRSLDAVHSPIHGIHPNIALGIKTFVKYIGGADWRKVALARKFLKAAGIKTKTVSCPEASELSKILCTTRYGWEIVFAKEVARMCGKYGVPFDEVYGWSRFYSKGYKKLKKPHFMRSDLKAIEGPISGHCVIPNCELMPDEFIMKTVLERNKTF